MSDDILIIRISENKKEALRNRAFELRLKGGMSELVLSLIDKELGTEQETKTIEQQKQ